MRSTNSQKPSQQIFRLSPIRATRLVADVDIPGKPTVLRAMDSAGDDLQEVSKLIMQDPALSMAVLKTVNSAWFALPVQVQRIDQAVCMLGLSNIKTLSKALCIRTISEKIAEPVVIKRFWRCAVLVGEYASILSHYLHLATKEEAYALGLIHDCGIPLLSSHYKNVESFFKEHSDGANPIAQSERDYFGVCHSELGYRLATAWSFPDTVSEAILCHHDFSKVDLSQFSSTNHLICLLKLAEYISGEHQILRNQKQNSEWKHIKRACLEYLSLSHTELEELKSICLLESGKIADKAS